ncbi:diguanylate cyclase [Pseudomonas stutzeri]|uniref:Diguanylate cyclase n=1 Tax=Stutzerimonas stutzeri TaxID=316 RepID=A0A2N8S6U5_STUST|nr:GGDEF domain-containing protein [Stutzerimonas stutzeri]MCQ4294648.1 diguanylate cyclase [Stutzerimonas stutzeri]PNF82348.1 diguanylate cyclase [Stutzerimonas stutzeri]
MKTDSCAPLASVIDLLLDAICVVDAQGNFVYVSAACERIFGYTPDEMLGKRMIEMVYPEDRARTIAAAQEVMASQPLLHFENRYLRKDGSVVHIMWSACWSTDNKLRIGVARDITQRKQSEAMQAALYSISEAAHGAKDLAALYQQIHLTIAKLLPLDDFIVAIRDLASGELTYPYQALALDSLGAPPEPGRSLCFSVLHGRQALRFNAESLSALALPLDAADAVAWWLGVPLNSSEGAIGVLLLKSSTAPYSEKDQELLQFVSTQVVTAIERQQLYARLHRMAQYDELTGLPNRACFRDRLETALARVRRNGGRIALLYVDLDRFKQVNDTYGHGGGDQLLRAVADRLTFCVRDTDTVARLGGDEFVVLLESIVEPEDAQRVVEKIRNAFAQPMLIVEHSIDIDLSIGTALYPEDGEAEMQLLKQADERMYRMKARSGQEPVDCD